MKTLAITVSNKKQEKLFADLAKELGIDITEAKFKPLTTKDVALGIGRKFTDDELEEYLERTSSGKSGAAKQVKARLRKRLSGKSSVK